LIGISVITLDSSAPIPPYEQVRAQIAAHVASGELAVGTKLPTVRQLATDLGLAVNTVARAYRELETANLIETRGRGGTFVTAAGTKSRAQLQESARAYARLVRNFSVPLDEAIAIVRSAIETP
jgi:DNA-binding transcriptional regulator YhcF (GntR family)